MRPIRRLVTVTAALIVPISVPAIAATAQWKPEQTVEIVIGSAAGSGPDRNARVMQKIFQDGRFVAVPVVVMNKPVVANAYISKFDGNGHYLLMSGKGLITTDIMGRLPFSYADLTPITHTMDEYIGIAVKADSSLKSGRELLDRLQKDPAALSVAVATALGNANHQAVAAAMKGTASTRGRVAS